MLYIYYAAVCEFFSSSVRPAVRVCARERVPKIIFRAFARVDHYENIRVYSI